MVAITSVVEAEVSCTPPGSASKSSPSPTKEGKIYDKLRTSKRSSQRILRMMLEDECENSFKKLPDEEPIHIWNAATKETIEKPSSHNHKMKKLDRKLARHNADITTLKEMLRLADEQRDAEITRMEQREQEARQEMLDLEQETTEVVHEEEEEEESKVDIVIQYGQLKARLDANFQMIRELRQENKTLQKELRKQEKFKDKLRFNNIQLEESSDSLLSSCSTLCDSQVFDENEALHNRSKEGEFTYDNYKLDVAAVQEKYMEQAQQRLDIQKRMAEILTMIQSSKTVPLKLTNACLDIGLDCEARSNQLMTELQQSEELNWKRKVEGWLCWTHPIFVESLDTIVLWNNALERIISYNVSYHVNRPSIQNSKLASSSRLQPLFTVMQYLVSR